MKIDFVCVGTQRSGTTWLHRCLQDHTQLLLPHKKELGIFLDPTLVEKDVAAVLEQEFPSPKPNALYGEINPTYYLHPDSLERVRAHNPDMKVIFCVREPVSKYRSEKAYFTGRYGEAFFTKTHYKKLYAGYKHMHYASILEELYGLFDKQNVHVVVYESLKTNAVETLQAIEDFLGVEHQAADSQTFNKTVNTAQRKTAVPAFDLFAVKVTSVLKNSVIGRSVLKSMKKIGIGSVIAKARVYNLKIGSKKKVAAQTLSVEEQSDIHTVLAAEIKAFAAMVPEVKIHWGHEWNI